MYNKKKLCNFSFVTLQFKMRFFVSFYRNNILFLFLICVTLHCSLIYKILVVEILNNFFRDLIFDKFFIDMFDWFLIYFLWLIYVLLVSLIIMQTYFLTKRLILSIRSFIEYVSLLCHMTKRCVLYISAFLCAYVLYSYSHSLSG